MVPEMTLRFAVCAVLLVSTPALAQPAPAVPIRVGAITAVAASDSYTCVLADGHPACIGSVPTGPADRGPVDARDDVTADQLFVYDDARCFSSRDSANVRCFGPVLLEGPTSADEARWDRECEEDDDCFRARSAAFDVEELRRGRTFRAPGGVQSLAGAESLMCALGLRGRIRCWNLVEPARPLRTMRVRGAVELAGAIGRMCARTSRGGVQCWEEYMDPRVTPATVEGVEGAVRMAVDEMMACAWDEAGEARCWGDEDWLFGEVELSPTDAVRHPRLDGVSAFAFSESGAACFVRDGRLECRGDARFGKLGRPLSAQDHPVLVTESPNAPGFPAVDGARLVAVGVDHGCAVSGPSTLSCWGRAEDGALGFARRRTNFAPREVPNVRADAIAAFDRRTCARRQDAWQCWGRLGFRDRTPEPWRPRASDTSRDAVPLALRGLACHLRGQRLTCPREDEPALSATVRDVVRNGTAPCWVGSDGRLACRLSNDIFTAGDLADVVAIGGRSGAVLALTREGVVHVLRRSYRTDGYVARDTMPAPMPVDRVFWGGYQVCVRRADGRVLCHSRRRGFEAVDGLGAVTLVASGSQHACVRQQDGAVACWGSSTRGELGREESSYTPVTVPAANGATALVAGASHTCALMGDGRVLCWGAEADGQLGARPAWWTEGVVQLTGPRP